MLWGAKQQRRRQRAGARAAAAAALLLVALLLLSPGHADAAAAPIRRTIVPDLTEVLTDQLHKASISECALSSCAVWAQLARCGCAKVAFRALFAGGFEIVDVVLWRVHLHSLSKSSCMMHTNHTLQHQACCWCCRAHTPSAA